MSGYPVFKKSSANARGFPSKGKTPPTKSVPYLSDVRLLPRVRKYLEDESTSNPLDVESVVTHLQQKYPEYRRKKRLTFTHSVQKAYDIVADELEDSLSNEDVDIFSSKRSKRQKHSHDKTSVEAANTSDMSFSDEGEYAEYLDSNTVNKTVTNMYLNSSPAVIVHQKSAAAQEVGEKKTGFLRCRSDPSINRDLQLEGLGYLDRGPRTPLNTNKLVESLPASPRMPSAADQSTDNTPSAARKPVIITIGDEEEGSITGTPKASQASAPAAKSGHKSTSTHKKKRKSSGTKAKDQNPTTPPVGPKKKGAIDAIYSTTKFSQIGGNTKTIEEVQKLLLHMKYPQIYQRIGVTPPRGFLLHGPPGCGKTLMAYAIAGELELPFFKLAATELVSGVSGESEERVRNLFAQATAHAPCILFIDEVDSITPKRETASKDMERRIVSQFLTCLDALCEKKDAHVLVIGATNRPDSLDPALRRAGRFDREISMGIPDGKARESILKVLCKDIRLSQNFDLSSISQLTPGYVGADLSSLVREAAMLAVNRIFASLEKDLVNDKSSPSVDASHTEQSTDEGNQMSQPRQADEVSTEHQQTGGDNNQPSVAKQMTSNQEETTSETGSLWKNLPSISEEMLSSLHIDMEDFLNAVKIVQPSAKREGFATVPDVTWEDVGALKAIREELQMAILAPVKYPEQFSSLGLTSPSGVLLAGPPGCGKTLLAKAIANESGVNFISVKGPELINMYVGESEKAVRQVFQRARNSSPCVIFFDELDSLCPRRSLSGSDGGSGSRIVNQLLTEMDGLQERKQVFIMGATNRPDIIDPAILRPGRLDKTLYVGLPTVEDRADILRTVTKNCTKPCIEGVDLAEIAALPVCDGFSGADLTAVVREASMAAMKEYISKETEAAHIQPKHPPRIILHRQHFDTALANIKPSISAKDQALYKVMSGG